MKMFHRSITLQQQEEFTEIDHRLHAKAHDNRENLHITLLKNKKIDNEINTHHYIQNQTNCLKHYV